jgi:hypothetical protein
MVFDAFAWMIGQAGIKMFLIDFALNDVNVKESCRGVACRVVARCDGVAR